MRWWSLGVPKCMVRVMSVVPQSNCPPESSSSKVLPSTCTSQGEIRLQPHQWLCGILVSVAMIGAEQQRSRSLAYDVEASWGYLPSSMCMQGWGRSLVCKCEAAKCFLPFLHALQAEQGHARDA